MHYAVLFLAHAAMLIKSRLCLWHSFGAGSFSWWLVNSPGCRPVYNTTFIDEASAALPPRPSTVEDCSVRYEKIEVTHAAIQLVISTLGRSPYSNWKAEKCEMPLMWVVDTFWMEYLPHTVDRLFFSGVKYHCRFNLMVAIHYMFLLTFPHVCSTPSISRKSNITLVPVPLFRPVGYATLKAGYRISGFCIIKTKILKINI